ncbi:DNA-binding transcriptional MerR regulator [Anaerotaenia torta]|uniref:MerR family transcriptional regulator n=1 Tax=Anaerotaenia torta TaxID=433293 RepID=UPI003D25FE93
MTIKEVEERTRLSRSNIRFYEKEKLIAPVRNENNGYREYTEEDIENIKKIAFLRTLDISIEEIRKIMLYETELSEIISIQYQKLDTQIEELQSAKSLCSRMLQIDNLNINDLKVEQYADDVDHYWSENKKVFKLDSVSFFYMWGGFITWGFITVLCLIVAALAYPSLPDKIPVQWSGGNVSSSVSKVFLFAYPLACILIRFFFKPYIWRWLQINAPYSENIANYITNFMCFVAFSIEIFTILFIAGIVKHITNILLIDTVVLIGLPLLGLMKTDTKDRN